MFDGRIFVMCRLFRSNYAESNIFRKKNKNRWLDTRHTRLKLNWFAQSYELNIEMKQFSMLLRNISSRKFFSRGKIFFFYFGSCKVLASWSASHIFTYAITFDEVLSYFTILFRTRSLLPPRHFILYPLGIFFFVLQCNQKLKKWLKNFLIVFICQLLYSVKSGIKFFIKLNFCMDLKTEVCRIKSLKKCKSVNSRKLDTVLDNCETLFDKKEKGFFYENKKDWSNSIIELWTIDGL